MVENEAGTGTLSYAFGRELDGLELSPGSYPVRLSVTADVDGSTEETEVATELLVYDSKTPSTTVVLVARVYGAPLSDPEGRLVIDPASPAADKPRADVDRVAALVLEDPGARLVIAVPPVLLAEWKQLSAGYTLADGTVVPAENPVPADVRRRRSLGFAQQSTPAASNSSAWATPIPTSWRLHRSRW